MAEKNTPNYFVLLFVLPIIFSLAVFNISNKYTKYTCKTSVDIDMDSEQISNLISDAKNNWTHLKRFLPELQSCNTCSLGGFSPISKYLLTSLDC